MPPIYREEFTITGLANVTTDDTGVTSTEAELKHVLGVMLYVSVHAANIIKGQLEREKIFGIYDYHIDTVEDTGGVNIPKGTRKEQYFELGHDIPLGKTFKIGITCGGTPENVFGAYVYELRS